MTVRHSTSPSPDGWTTQIRRGTGVVIFGRYGLVEEVFSTRVRVRFHDDVLNVSRRGEGSEVEDIEWPDVLGPSVSAMIMDKGTARVWASWRPHNQRRTMARLALVNLLGTGCRSGQEGIANDVGEPIDELRSRGRSLYELEGQIHARAVFLNRWLQDSQLEWALALRAELNRTSDANVGADHKVPSVRSIERAVEAALAGGLYALCDGRGGDQYADNVTGERRRATRVLLDEVIASRNPRTLSAKSASWVMREVRRAAEKHEVAILNESALKAMVRERLKSSGRTPLQVTAEKHADERTEYQNSRPWAPGLVLAFDETQGDNLVRMTPGGEPMRPHTHAVIDVCTGVVIAADATGFYRDINVAMVLYDAVRPLVVLPDPNGRQVPRIKGMPQQMLMAEGVFKPGAVGARMRSDNIAQNHSIFMAGLMNLLRSDISPSRPGVHTDNAYAENALLAFREFYEDAAAYVGRHTGERASRVGEDGVLLIDEYRSMLQQFAFFDHNHAPNTHPRYKHTGLSRLALWDLLIAELGAPPMLTDPNAWFSFLQPRSHKRTRKGIEYGGQLYSSRELFALPDRLVGLDRATTFLVDGRQQDCIWVPDPVEGVFCEIPNILRDHTDAPLTREISAKAQALARVVPTGGFHAAKAFARAAEHVRSDGEPSRKIQRSLADMRAAWWGYAEPQAAGPSRAGARVGGARAPVAAAGNRSERERTDTQADSVTKIPFARTGPGSDPGDDLDRPIKRKGN